MDLQADIKWIHTEIDKVEDATLLEAIKSMLKYRAKVVQPKRISIEQHNKEVNEARVEKGEFYTQEEAEKIMDKW